MRRTTCIDHADAAAEPGAWAKGESCGEGASRWVTRPELGDGGGCLVNIYDVKIKNKIIFTYVCKNKYHGKKLANIFVSINEKLNATV